MISACVSTGILFLYFQIFIFSPWTISSISCSPSVKLRCRPELFSSSSSPADFSSFCSSLFVFLFFLQVVLQQQSYHKPSPSFYCLNVLSSFLCYLRDETSSIASSSLDGDSMFAHTSLSGNCERWTRLNGNHQSFDSEPEILEWWFFGAVSVFIVYSPQSIQ